MKKIPLSILNPNLKSVNFNKINKQQLFDFLISIFNKYEPLNVACRITKNQSWQQMIDFLQKSYECQFSNALVNQKNQIVSALAVLTWKQYAQMQAVKTNSMKVKAIEQIYELCNKLYQPKEEEYQKSLYFDLAATHPQYTGKGLMTSMLKNLIKSAKKQGIKQILADCSSPSSEKVVKNEGFEFKGIIKYSQFQFNNQKPFKNIKTSLGVSRYVLNLDLI